METLKGLKRTHYCGDLRIENAGEEVILNGWVQKKRNLGGLVFVDLRDIRGISQIIFDADVSKDAFEKAEKAEIVLRQPDAVSAHPAGAGVFAGIQLRADVRHCDRVQKVPAAERDFRKRMGGAGQL